MLLSLHSHESNPDGSIIGDVRVITGAAVSRYSYPVLCNRVGVAFLFLLCIVQSISESYQKFGIAKANYPARIKPTILEGLAYPPRPMITVILKCICRSCR